MKKVLVLGFILILGLSCKVEKADTQGGVRELRDEELQSLNRICESLQDKREYFNTLGDRQAKFSLRSKKRDCGDTTEFDMGPFNADLRIQIGKDDWLEARNRSRYLKDIVNDQNGDIKTFCQTVLSGAVVENTALVGATKLQILAGVASNYDNFHIAKARKNSNGAWIVYEIEKASVITSRSGTAQNYLGILKERLIVKDCSSGADQTFRQIFTSF